MMDEIERELRDSFENVVVGAVEQGVLLAQAQKYVAQWVERLNAEPLERRCRMLEFVSGRSLSPEMVAAISFEAEVAPDEADPLHELVMHLRANVRMLHPVEDVWFAVSLADPRPVLCASCGLTRGDPEANHYVKIPGTVGPGGINENGYYPHVFEPRDDG